MTLDILINIGAGNSFLSNKREAGNQNNTKISDNCTPENSACKPDHFVQMPIYFE